MQDIFLRSGKWRWSVVEERSPLGGMLELIDPAAPHNKMNIRLPPAWRELSSDQVAELARQPEIRLWTDEHGIVWRIARVGPGSHYPYPLETPHLVFDSQQAYAGLVPIPDDDRLGDLTDPELRRFRDRMQDFGGRRRAFRAPVARSA